MNNITVICNEEHEIVPGACALCERDQLREQNKELVEALEQIRNHTIGATAFTNKEGLYATVTDRINGIEDIAPAAQSQEQHTPEPAVHFHSSDPRFCRTEDSPRQFSPDANTVTCPACKARDTLVEQNKELAEACGRLLKWGPTHNGKTEYHKDSAFARAVLAKIT